MQRLLLSLLVFLGCTGLKAQFVDAGIKITGQIAVPSTSKVTNRSAANPKNCDWDTLTFPSMGSSAYNSVTVRKGFSLGQFYGAPGDVQVSGFRFYGFAIIPSGSAYRKVNAICNLYKAGSDSLPSGSPLASDTITIDTVLGTSIPLSKITHEAVFNKTISFTNDHYIVVVESDSSDGILAIVTNSYANGDGDYRNIGCGSVSGKWYRCMNLNIGGTTFNAHMQFFPFAKYKFGTDFTTTQQCFPNFDTLRFPSNFKKTPAGSVYYNYYAYLDEMYPTFQYQDYCHQWLFDNTTFAVGKEGKFKPRSRKNIPVRLSSVIYTYSNSSYCRDTADQLIYFNPTIPIPTKVPSGCIGDSLRIALSSDAGVTVEWYKKMTDTKPFFTGNNYTISKLLSNDTFYVRAVNNNCASKMGTLAISAFNYPTKLTTNNDSLCAGAAANLTASTDKGEIQWFTSQTGGNPIYVGNTLTTGKLSRDTFFYVQAINGVCALAGGRTKVQALVGSNFAPESPTVLFTDTTVCAKTGSRSIELKATLNGSDTVRWFNDASAGTLLGKGSSYTYTAPAVRGSYSVYVESWNGVCGSGRTPVNVIVNNYSIVFGPKGDVICAGDSADLFAAPQWGEIRWYSDKVSSAFAVGNSVKLGDITKTRYVYFKPAEGNCESATFDSVEVVVNDVPKPTTVSAPSICAKALGELLVDVPYGTVTWYDDASATTPVYTGENFKLGMVLAGQTYYYEISNKNCVSKREVLELKVLPRPTAGFTWTLLWQHKINCVPITTTGLTVFWEWGDGQTKSGLPGVHQYASAGNYIVRMIATSNSNGCKDTADIPVIVDHLGLAGKAMLSTMVVYPNPVTAGEMVEFNGLNEGKVQWMNANGAVVAESTIVESTTAVPSDLSQGLYFLQIGNNKQQFAPVKLFVR